jgi:hypothetical protein
LLRDRGAAMAEFWRALRTFKALQAEQAAGTDARPEAHPARPTPRAARPPLVQRPQPDEPERIAERRLGYPCARAGAPGRGLHEPAAPWLPNEPWSGAAPHTRAPVGGVDRAPSAQPSGADRRI